jgi:2-polyprenyl-3-methyl-5-hydroxy-6-metoxy-1,4-benzoquinol methylase
MSNYSDSKFNKDENSSWQKTFNLVPEKTTVLDIGCSNGVFGERLIKEKECTVDGIEIDKGDIAEAKKKLRKVYEINIENQPLALQETYDVVFMGDVIEHLARPAETLTKVKGLLKPDGIFIFSIPNITHMLVRLMLLGGKIDYGRTGLLDETHLHFYNSAEIKRVLNAAGFSIVLLDYTVNDLPKEILHKEFKELGLDVRPEFYKIANTLDAVAYQFVGVAKKGVVKKDILPKTSPENIVDKYHNELKGEYEKSLKAVTADKQNMEQDLKRLQEENEKLNKLIAVRVSKYIKGRATRIRGTEK